MTEAALEQQDEAITADVELINDESDQTPIVEAADGEIEEFDIVLTGQEEQPKEQPDPKSFILKRMSKKNGRLEDENAELKRQIEQANQPKSTATMLPPDEYDFEDRGQFLQAKAQYDRQMMDGVISARQSQQQNAHRLQAAQQEDEAKLSAYAASATELKVADFNERQDKAMEVLGEDLGRLIATQIPNPKDAAKLMYWFGTTPKDAAKYRDMYQSNPGAMTFHLGQLARDLTVTKRESKAAQPERRVDATSSGGINEDWQSRYDKVMDSSDSSNISKTIREMRDLKKQAKAAGFDTTTFK